MSLLTSTSGRSREVDLDTQRSEPTQQIAAIADKISELDKKIAGAEADWEAALGSARESFAKAKYDRVAAEKLELLRQQTVLLSQPPANASPALQAEVKSMQSRMGVLELENKTIQTQLNQSLHTSQKERDIGEVYYTTTTLDLKLLDNKGLPDVASEKLEAVRESILDFFKKLKALPQLHGARTAADSRTQGKKAVKRSLERPLAASVADLSCIPEVVAASTQQAAAATEPTAAIEQAVRQIAEPVNSSGVQTRTMRRLSGAQAASASPKSASSLKQLLLVPAGEKLSEPQHMQPQVFELLLRVNKAMGGVLHLADTHAENGFASPPAFIDCSGLATRLRAWVQLVLPVEFKLDDMRAALGQLIGRFRVAAEQQGKGRSFMFGVGITLDAVEVFYFEQTDCKAIHVSRTGFLPMEFDVPNSAGVVALARLFSSSLSQLGYMLTDVPQTVSCTSEPDRASTVTASIDALVRIGSTELHRASKVYAAHLSDGTACVLKVNNSSREVDILRKLVPGHPHLVRLVGSSTVESGTWVLLSPFAQPLNYYTKTNEIIQVTYDVTTALEYLESKGVLHRDVSPGNVGSVAGRGVLYDFSSSKDMSSPVKERDGLSFVTGTPVAASLGRLRGKDAEFTDDLESLFLTVNYILTGGKVFGQQYFLGGDIHSMALARTGAMFNSELDSVDLIREARSKSFVVDLYRIFFPMDQLGGVRYRRDVNANEVKEVCQRHFPSLLK